MPGAIRWKEPSSRPSRKVERFVPSKLELPKLAQKVEDLQMSIPIVEAYLRKLKREKARGSRARGLTVKLMECEAWLETGRALLQKAEAAYARKTREPDWMPDVSMPFHKTDHPADIAVERITEEEKRKKIYNLWKKRRELHITVGWDIPSLEWHCHHEKDGEDIIFPLGDLLGWRDLQQNMRLDYLLRLAIDLKLAAEKAIAKSLRRELLVQEICKDLHLTESEAKRYLEE